MRDTLNNMDDDSHRGYGPRALFATFGRFSHINAQLLDALEMEFPEVTFETFNVGEAMRSNYAGMLSSLVNVPREYGVWSFRSRAVLRYRLFRNKAYFNTAEKLLQERFGDHRFNFTVQTQSMFSAALPNCPNFVYTDHVARARLADEDHEGTGYPSEPWLDCERRIYEKAAHVFTFGPKIRNFLIEDYGIAPNKVSAIGAGASVRPAHPLNTSLDRYGRRNILFVGVEWDRKGGPELIEAFVKVRQSLPDVTLTIVGCSPEIDIEGCEVVGRLPLSEIEGYFRRASCFCMPSRVEPFGIVFLEAMQFGLPIVSTTAGDIGAIVRNGETGWLVAPKDGAGLAQALFQVLVSAETCREMGLAGLERGESFTWGGVARRLMAYTLAGREGSAAMEVNW
ncbi:glycosyltransferase family 4 protein [Ruegeria atlantica]|uniref:Glycogen synthase n=1 Tax=Ruegeria atlantica TaxID=81569 RepID=A0A0P1E276_9RHOB|nr:glycosyltransferase family 4 protein [Ruegeria atlantica]CUH42206.1 Glycogen synthase [Ruegeria atlantica]